MNGQCFPDYLACSMFIFKEGRYISYHASGRGCTSDGNILERHQELQMVCKKRHSAGVIQQELVCGCSTWQGYTTGNGIHIRVLNTSDVGLYSKPSGIQCSIKDLDEKNDRKRRLARSSKSGNYSFVPWDVPKYFTVNELHLKCCC